MQRILSAHLWRTIKAQASKSRNRKVAVAYVTKDLIGFATDSPAALSALVFLSDDPFSPPVELTGGALPLPQQVLIYVQSHV